MATSGDVALGALAVVAGIVLIGVSRARDAVPEPARGAAETVLSTPQRGPITPPAAPTTDSQERFKSLVESTERSGQVTAAVIDAAGGDLGQDRGFIPTTGTGFTATTQPAADPVVIAPEDTLDVATIEDVTGRKIVKGRGFVSTTGTGF